MSSEGAPRANEIVVKTAIGSKLIRTSPKAHVVLDRAAVLGDAAQANDALIVGQQVAHRLLKAIAKAGQLDQIDRVLEVPRRRGRTRRLALGISRWRAGRRGGALQALVHQPRAGARERAHRAACGRGFVGWRLLRPMLAAAGA